MDEENRTKDRLWRRVSMMTRIAKVCADGKFSERLKAKHPAI